MLELLPLRLGGDGHAASEDDIDLCHLLIAIRIYSALINSSGLMLRQRWWWWHLLPIQKNLALF
jgi:hypothetical protein